MKKRIICWGFGSYGQYIIDKIQNCWKEEFQLIGVADKECDRLNSDIRNKKYHFEYMWMKEKITKVYSLYEVRQLYENHEIDGVVVTVRNPQIAIEIEEDMGKHNVSIISLKDYWNFLSAEIIADKEYEACDSYKVYVVKNIKGVMSLNHEVVLLYDSSGNIIKESFNYFYYRSVMENIICPIPVAYNHPKEIQVEKCCVLARCWSYANYGHFIQECMDKLYAMEESGFDGKYMLFDSEFARSFLNILGVAPERIIWVDSRNDDKLYIIKELHCVGNVQGRSEKCALVLERLSKKIISNLHLDSNMLQGYPKRIYVKRIGRRKLLGIEDILEKYGFLTIIPEQLTLAEQIKHFYAADIVLSPHGANSTNSLYMRRGTHFIETFGRKYVYAYYLQSLALQGVHYHMLVEFGQDVHDTSMGDHSDYCLDLSLLELILQDVCREGNFKQSIINRE